MEEKTYAELEAELNEIMSVLIFIKKVKRFYKKWKRH